LSRRVNSEIVKTGEMAEARAYVDWIEAAPPGLFADYRAYLGRLGHSTVFFSLPKIDWYTVNRVMGLGIFEQAEESMLHDMLKVCKDRSVTRIFVPICPETKPDTSTIEKWLHILGFKPYNTWVKLSRGNKPFEKTIDCEFKILRIEKECARDFAETVINGFSYPTEFSPWLELLVGRAGWYPYLAYSGDRPVASGALFINDSVGYLGLGSTLSSFRRRGAQEALIQRRIQDGIALGCKQFFTETTEDSPQNPNPSFHNMLRAGFQLEYARQNFVLQLR